MKDKLRALGFNVAKVNAEHLNEFEKCNRECKHRYPVQDGIAVCDHPENKRIGTNYSGCFYDSCPFVMFWLK